VRKRIGRIICIMFLAFVVCALIAVMYFLGGTVDSHLFWTEYLSEGAR
jgi:hypothetical protein